MSNELRDPHDPVIPGEHVLSPEGHGGVSMPIGQSNPGFDPHEPVLPKVTVRDVVEFQLNSEAIRETIQHTEDQPEQVVIDPIAQHIAQAQVAIDQQKAEFPSGDDLDAAEAEKAIADSTAKTEGAKGRVSRRP